MRRNFALNPKRVKWMAQEVASTAVEPVPADSYVDDMPGSWKQKIWERLREAIRASGLSYTEIALRAPDVEAKHLSAFMRAKGGLDLDKVEQVAKVLGVDLLSLVEGDVQSYERGRLVPVAFLKGIPAGARGAALVAEIDRRAHREARTARKDQDARGIELDQDFSAASMLTGDIMMAVPIKGEADLKHLDVMIAAIDGELTPAVYWREKPADKAIAKIPPDRPRADFVPVARMIQLIRNR
jgi:transcriptional regulator with XRE-family HTH domain